MLDTPAYEAKESDALSNSENGPHKGRIVASLELLKLYKGRVMLVAFRMKTSPSRIADALLKNTPLEQSFNAHLEAIPISSIDFEHESILSGTFSEFSDDYLML